MILRSPTILSQDVLADTETTVNIPVRVNKIEVQIKDTEDGSGTDADGRIAFEVGETADSGNHLFVNPDWWEDVKLPANTKLYLRSAIVNTFKILYWEGS